MRWLIFLFIFPSLPSKDQRGSTANAYQIDAEVEGWSTFRWMKCNLFAQRNIILLKAWLLEYIDGWDDKSLDSKGIKVVGIGPESGVESNEQINCDHI